MITPASSIALSGLNVQSARVNTSAHAVANVSTPGFIADEVVAQDIPSGGARPQIRSTERPTSLIREAVTQIQAVAAYRANLQTIATEDDMLGSLLRTEA